MLSVLSSLLHRTANYYTYSSSDIRRDTVEAGIVMPLETRHVVRIPTDPSSAHSSVNDSLNCMLAIVSFN